MGLEIFKLEKLKIEAFENAERTKSAGVFEAMFNPTQLQGGHKNQWDEKPTTNASGSELQYSFTRPSDLKLELTFDGTGVDELGIFAPKARSVADRIKELKDVAFKYIGNLHEPHYLRATWGTTLNFNCRGKCLDIKYTLFDRDGSPLRAEVTIVLIADEPKATLAKQENKQSPDITHARTIRAGDSLPALTKNIYGSSEHYLLVARFNDLDDFRLLTPGQQLLFPPLAELAVKGARG